MRHLLLLPLIASGADLRLATFQADVTPPLGTPLCFALVKPGVEVVDPLTARGVILTGNGAPVVLVAVDWLGISNEAHDAWRRALAQAAGTTPDRVTVHVLHQHDAPGHDDTASRITRNAGLPDAVQHDRFMADAVQLTAASVRVATHRLQPVTHAGTAAARVERVASNRRILGPDEKVKYVRYSSSRIPEAIAAPEGTVDPELVAIAFWNDAKPLAVLTYYATHPQSHYGQGGISWEFPGMARQAREQSTGVAHIHFNGASGNVAAGKYNNGDPENRAVLASRMQAGMAAAFASIRKTPVTAADLHWNTVPVALPLRGTLSSGTLSQTVSDPNAKLADRLRAARDLAWVERIGKGHKITLSRLRVGPAEAIHLPGELFIEYQLGARALRPGKALGVAAYGDLGPGYIGTQIAYSQGGYETGIVSRTAPEVEGVLTAAIRNLME
ncbi:MAG: hypothetical protein FJW39_27850 [Acidobacteria bacterium]|nr:hypothetical protein [Acidobacteriota bacterium]